MGVVSFRLNDTDEQRLLQAGIRPGAEAKAHILAVLARLEVAEDFTFYDKVRVPTDIPTADLVRADRASH